MTKEIAKPIAPPTQDPQAWATRITAHVTASVQAILAAGRDLLAAKAALQHGAWERMFKDHEHAVPEPLPFGVRTAQRLMAIAGHPVLGKATHGSPLPLSWRTLYELTTLPGPVLQQAMTDGRVHPEMTRLDVHVLADPFLAFTTALARYEAAWARDPFTDEPFPTVEAWVADYERRVDDHNREADEFVRLHKTDPVEETTIEQRGDTLRAEKVEVIARLERFAGRLLLTDDLVGMTPEALGFTKEKIGQYKHLARLPEKVFEWHIECKATFAKWDAPAAGEAPTDRDVELQETRR